MGGREREKRERERERERVRESEGEGGVGAIGQALPRAGPGHSLRRYPLFHLKRGRGVEERDNKRERERARERERKWEREVSVSG